MKQGSVCVDLPREVTTSAIALDALALDGLLEPVQTMLNLLLGFLPNLFAAALIAKYRGPAREFKLYGVIVLEAVLYAWLLGPAGYLVLSASPDAASVTLRVLLYVGAGVWEELVFRLFLLGGFVWVTTRALGGNGAVFAALGVLVSSLTFSLFQRPSAGPL